MIINILPKLFSHSRKHDYPSYDLDAGALKGRWLIGIAAQGLTGTGRWWLGLIWRRFGTVEVGVEEAAVAEDDDEETATRSQEEHMVRVVGGFMCM